MKLCSLVPSSYIHISVSDLYIPSIGLPIWLQQKRQTDPGNIHVQKHKCGNWDAKHYNSVLKITRPAKFHFWEYINGNQTFILDSHRPFICSVQEDKLLCMGIGLDIGLCVSGTRNYLQCRRQICQNRQYLLDC